MNGRVCSSSDSDAIARMCICLSYGTLAVQGGDACFVMILIQSFMREFVTSVLAMGSEKVELGVS